VHVQSVMKKLRMLLTYAQLISVHHQFGLVGVLGLKSVHVCG